MRTWLLLFLMTASVSAQIIPTPSGKTINTNALAAGILSTAGTNIAAQAAAAVSTANLYTDAATNNSAVVKLGEIAVTTLTNSVRFGNIPQSFARLEIASTASSTTNAATDTVFFRLSDDDGTNYIRAGIYSNNGGAPGADNQQNNQTAGWLTGMAGTGSGNTTNQTCGSMTRIFSYAAIGKYKNINSEQLHPAVSQGTSWQKLWGTWCISTNTVTSVTIFLSGGNFATNSMFRLYGVR